MQDYQREFLQLALDRGVLKFGEFELKSGRTSPYFFNAGLFNTGADMATLGRCYAAALEQAYGEDYDLLFGPAYKGIPLVTTTAVALANNGHDVPWCFNRKEAKTHGEGGNLVGAALSGNVVIVDDVITAGTAIRESLDIINAANGANAYGVLVALDRQERGQGELSAIQELEQERGLKVASIIQLADLITWLEEQPGMASELAAVSRYREEFGV